MLRSIKNIEHLCFYAAQSMHTVSRHSSYCVCIDKLIHAFEVVFLGSS
jgi:hypothetical protein